MKKTIAKILVLTIFCTTLWQMHVFATEEKTAYSQSGENMLNFMKSDFDELLLIRKNYAYMSFVENFQGDCLSLYLLKMADIFAETGAEPDEEKYIEVLTNIIATYDLDNAVDVAEQYKLDNLKNVKDYAMDIASIATNAVSVMAGLDTSASKLESAISTAVSGVSTLTENTDNWIEALSNLETIVDDYTKYDAFLDLIEKNSDGELKQAAGILRNGMKAAMNIKLNTYTEIGNENFKNYEKFFFNDVFFSALKQSPEYDSDENLKFFVDYGDDVISKANVLKDSWDLGKAIGKLVGDIAVGGEDLINRVLEMMALHEISVILQEKIIDLEGDFLNDYGTFKEEDIISEYILYSQYLIGCRIRGEYCIYSIIAKDANLLSWFHKEDAEQAKEWYEDKTNQILIIQENLLNIYNVSDTYATEDSLKELLTSSTSEPILNFLYDDFDNNGSFEAVAFCGKYYDDPGYYEGTLYFVSESGVKVIREEDWYWNCGEIFDFGNVKIILITKYFTTGGLSYYYQVHDNEIMEFEGSGYGEGLFQDDQGRICMTDSQYDACIDGTGHTWNVYYFYWDNGLHEYGGTQITMEEFSTYSNADVILQKISGDGLDITSIYKRQNGIININCCDGWSNYNLRVVLKDGTVEMNDDFYAEGIIKAAMIPEIATY